MNNEDRALVLKLIESNNKLIADNTANIKNLNEHTITLNKELGQILGQLTWIRWLLCALLGVIIASSFIL